MSIQATNGEIHAYLWFEGDFDPNQITKILGMKATKPLSKAKTNLPEDSSRINKWRLDSRLAKTASLQSHVEDVLEQISSKLPEVKSLCECYNAMIECVIYNYECQSPQMTFDKNLIKTLSNLGLGLDIDFYCMSS